MPPDQNNISNNQSPNDNTEGQYPNITQNDNPAKTKSNQIEIPSITLPKGGGAIKSIDEKFEVNAANGKASFSITFPVSPGRSGFTPSLSLSYNSGGGNSLFGIGWNLSPPSISRKTEKKLPEYNDQADSDTFIFSGAEDLVSLLIQNEETQEWEKHSEPIDSGEIMTDYDLANAWMELKFQLSD